MFFLDRFRSQSSLDFTFLSQISLSSYSTSVWLSKTTGMVNRIISEEIYILSQAPSVKGF